MERRRSEKTLRFKEVFIARREEGFSVSEISKQCHISVNYGYKLLQEIADENGVTREELLKGKGDQSYSYKRREPKDKTNRKPNKGTKAHSMNFQKNCFGEMQREMELELKSIDVTIARINDMLKW